MIKERRRARRIWQQLRHLEDKNYFNRINNQLNRLIKNIKNKSFEEYLDGLSADTDTDYSLWKATSKFKQPIIRTPSLKDEAGMWLRRDEEKTEQFARHLSKVFQPHDIQSEIVTTKAYKDVLFKYISPLEVAQEIDNNIKPGKVPGIDEISPRVLKELSRKRIVLLTYIFNACFRLEHVPNSFKSAQIIMLKKPEDKPKEEVTSYRPISAPSDIQVV